jgi:hypothetical protein
MYTIAPNNSSTPTSPSKTFASVTIKNFGQMDNHFYRGAQPKEEEYKELAKLGVKSIIDLRDNPLPYADKAAEAAKMRFNIPFETLQPRYDQSLDKVCLSPPEFRSGPVAAISRPHYSYLSPCTLGRLLLQPPGNSNALVPSYLCKHSSKS